MASTRSREVRRRAAAPAAPRRAGSQTGSRLGRELAAIGLAAAAVFLGAVLYLGWDGGAAGRWLGEASRLLVGSLTYAVPPLLGYAAWALAAGQEQRPRRGVSWGVAMVVVAFLLAAAGVTFGLGGGERPARLFREAWVRDHGGVIGDALWGTLHPLLGDVGVDVAVVALALAGVLLVTGTSLRQWASHSRRGVDAAGRLARRRVDALAARRREEAVATASTVADETATRLLARTEDDQPAGLLRPRLGQPAPRPRLIDGAEAAPEIFGEADAARTPALPGGGSPPPHDGEPGTDRGDGTAEQLTLAAAEPAGQAGAAAGATFAAAQQRQWRLPDPSLLRRLGESPGESAEAIARVSQRLVETLGHFGIPAQVVGTVSGPRVTRYELQLAPGIKVSRVASLKADIAYALAATDVRVLAPIPGKTAVGVEVPNVQASYVALGDIYGPFPSGASPMAFWLGKDVTGKPVLADLVKMVHLLIAGTTGSGKSGCLNALITSVLLRATPDEVRMIMIDPKKVELSNFNGVPHLLAPVVTNMKQATYVLDNICREMDRRYEVLSRRGCQDIRALNQQARRRGEEGMPYIMVVIDELADLMMAAPSEIEDSIIRLGQLGRSCGIHLVVATQRPSVDVVTGMIKTNIPSRIAFAVSSQTDSRIILDQGGAESLLGMGDMLFSPLGSNRLLRVQGAFVTPQEMKLVTEHWRRQAKPDYREDLLENPAGPDADQQGGPGGGDELLADAIRTVVTTGAASVALLQRRLRVGYARAGRLIDMMEEMGIISGYDGSKARSVLIDEEEMEAVLARLATGEAQGGLAAGEPPAPHDGDAPAADAAAGVGRDGDPDGEAALPSAPTPSAP